MTTSDYTLTTPAEYEALRRLRRLVLRADGACLVFVWSSSALQLDAMREHLDSRLLARAQRVRCIRIAESEASRQTPADAVEPWLQRVLDPGPGEERNAVWVQVEEPSGGTSSDADRYPVLRYFLARLNERRGQALGFPRALVIAAPAGLDALAASAAPDLWSVRSLSLELPAPVPYSPMLAPQHVYDERETGAPAPSLRLLEQMWGQAWAAYRKQKKRQKKNGTRKNKARGTLPRPQINPDGG